jgi:2-deoxy-D-gluconate 3-dehydrogenase
VAGWHRRKAAETYTDDEIEGIWRVNLGGCFTLCRDVAAAWFASDLEDWEQGLPRKKIINTASVLSFTGGTGLAAYTATKGGIAQVTKTFSNEWAARGINVNAIAPGYIRTDLTQDLQDDPEKNREVMRRTPLGRWGTTEDLAGLVVFLASGASDFVTGAVMAVDGGYTAR